MSKPILCLDFDGVLHAYSKGWQDGTIYDGPVPGAMAFLRDALNTFRVAIYSSRSADQARRKGMMSAVKRWLIAEWGEEEGERIYAALSFPTSKPSAFVTLDDRAITFTGTFPSPMTLRTFVPWTQRPDFTNGLPPYPYTQLIVGSRGPELVILPQEAQMHRNTPEGVAK